MSSGLYMSRGSDHPTLNVIPTRPAKNVQNVHEIFNIKARNNLKTLFIKHLAYSHILVRIQELILLVSRPGHNIM